MGLCGDYACALDENCFTLLRTGGMGVESVLFLKLKRRFVNIPRCREIKMEIPALRFPACGSVGRQ
jgi:hypothetical protein